MSLIGATKLDILRALRDCQHTGYEIASELSISSGCVELDEPFHFTELHKLSDGTSLDENYSRQPAYVYEHGTQPE